jgi:NAD(P)-dependent dehydrogenase (short-subunit alcohol dehydrogenase family)
MTTLSSTGQKLLLSNRVFIVTGASRGIGAATARALAAAGAKVGLAARNEQQLDSLRDEIGGDRALAVVTDVTDEASVRRMVERTLESFGRLDGAVNNAGEGHMPKLLADIPTEDFDASYALNLRGPFLCMKYQIPAMLRSGGGAIVNVSSTAGNRGVKGLGAYVATKHGLGGLSKTAALDYAAQGIRVNTITPGPIENDRIAMVPEAIREQMNSAVPMGRIGQPEEVAALIAWLCSDAACFITGASIAIDGGQLAGIHLTAA